MSEKIILLDNLNEYTGLIEETYIVPLENKIDGLNLQKSHGDRTISTKPRINESGEIKEAHAYQKDSIALAYKGQAGMTAEEFAEKYPSGKDDWGHTYEQSFGIAFAEGLETKALGRNSHAQNRATKALANDSSASGVESTASGINGSNANGFQTQASGSSSFTANYQTKATNQATSAFGIGGEASGKGAFKTGGYSTASGEYSFTEGVNTQAVGNYSHAQNRGTQALADDSNASGVETVASGINGSNANGHKTNATGEASFTANFGTTASGTYASAFGKGGDAKGSNSFKIGDNNVSEGSCTFSLGANNTSVGYCSTVGGFQSRAGGSAPYSLVYGRNLKATGADQAVLGAYNNPDTKYGAYPRLIVGGGSSENTRNNAFVVLPDGTLYSSKGKVALIDDVNEIVKDLQALNTGYDCAELYLNDREAELATILKNNIEFTYDSDTECLTIIKCNNVFNRLSCIHLLVDSAPIQSVILAAGAFSECTKLITLELGLEHFCTISINSGVFVNCTSLKYLDFGFTVDPLHNECISAFSGCESLTAVNLHSSTMTEISMGMFNNCYSLSHILLPNTLESIEAGAFARCTSLSAIKIPKLVNYIDMGAFNGCFSLTLDFTDHEFVPTLSEFGFGDVPGLTILVPAALYDDWCTDSNWAQYCNYIYKKT